MTTHAMLAEQNKLARFVQILAQQIGAISSNSPNLSDSKLSAKPISPCQALHPFRLDCQLFFLSLSLSRWRLEFILGQQQQQQVRASNPMRLEGAQSCKLAQELTKSQGN